MANIAGIILSTVQKNGILAGDKLDDLVIDTAQNMLKTIPRIVRVAVYSAIS